jgi:8-oxo-dGTP pyrophosphatase MutT (NUDIX family)
MELKPWTVLSSKTVLKDKWIDVRADDCITAEGALIAPYYVLSYPDWVHVVAIDHLGNVLLVEQYRHGTAEMSLEVPGGGVESAEEPLEAAQRELLEETGYSGTEWRYCGRLSPNPAIQSNYSHIILATGVSKTQSERDDPTERMQVRLTSIAEAIDYALSGQICQSLHVSALLIALHGGNLAMITCAQ